MGFESKELNAWHQSLEREDLSISRAADKIVAFVKENPVTDTQGIDIEDYPEYVEAAHYVIKGIHDGFLKFGEKNQFWLNVAQKIIDEEPYSLKKEKAA